MAKRQADESLEDAVAHDSPATKKARVDELPDAIRETNGFNSLPSSPLTANGHEHKEDEKNPGKPLAKLEQIGERHEKALSPAPSIDSQEEQSAYSAASRQTAPLDGYTDLYLDTIDRSVLDFDFEKLCSVTLSNINVYACLVCGKYYQGRGPKSHAYFHALEVGHHVFVNMQTKRVYVLPEGYEVKSKSLEDIKFVVDPRLSKDEVGKLDKESKEALDLVGKTYRPGLNSTALTTCKSNAIYRLCRDEQH